MNQKRILVVDDKTENIDVLFNILSGEYEVLAATGGRQALDLLKEMPLPDLILLDIVMPDMDGLSVCWELKRSVKTKNIPIIFVTSRGEEIDETLGLSLGAVDYLAKPVSPPVVLSRIKTHLALYDQKKHLEDLVKERTRELRDTQLKIIHTLAKAGEFKDNETGMHVIRMSHYAQLLGIRIGLPKSETDLIFQIVPMHDIGKIGIPDRILLKPGSLTPEERKTMETHVYIGADILGDDNCEVISEARVCALSHHEKWDGTGYPKGLKGSEIPMYGRITAVADVFDALCSDRPYKKAWPVKKAVDYLIEQKDKHFDPVLVDAFTEILPEIMKIMETFKD